MTVAERAIGPESQRSTRPRPRPSPPVTRRGTGCARTPARLRGMVSSSSVSVVLRPNLTVGRPQLASYIRSTPNESRLYNNCCDRGIVRGAGRNQRQPASRRCRAMYSHEHITGLLQHFPVVLWVLVWMLSRSASESRPSPPRSEPRLDTRGIARSVSGWRTASRRRRHEEPAPTPSPRSHPLWDRELDG